MSVPQNPTDASRIPSQDVRNAHPSVADKISPLETEQSSLDGSVRSEKHPRSPEHQKSNASNIRDELTDKTASGEPLDRVPSQAHKLGKKKIIIIMTALCVRRSSLATPLPAGKVRPLIATTI